VIRQGQVDLADLVARIRREFPQLHFTEATLNDLGEDHAVVVLDERWVFRFPRSEAVAAHAASERRLLAALNAASPVATPRCEHVSRSGDFAGYQMIAGTPLTEDVFAALTRAAQECVLAEIGDFLAVLHGLPAELIADGPGGFEDADRFADLYRERRRILAEALGPALTAAADRFYAAFPAAVATSRRAVIHRDFSEDHILLDPMEGRLAGVIDFTDAALGDPAFDFSCLWAYGRWAPAEAARSYGADADTPGLLSRALWWFTRYRVDQVWWSVSGARDYDVVRIKRELKDLFATLGV
jgi:aminoglycoside 2''-phosphotransferase